MQHIFSSLKSTIARKQFTPHMVARLALNELAVLLNYSQLEGYLRYSILYVELPEQSDIITLFTNKPERLARINTIVQEYNSKLTIKDIRHKKLKKSEGNGDGFH